MKPKHLLGTSFRHSGMAVCSVVTTNGDQYRLLAYDSSDVISMNRFDSWLAEALEGIEFVTVHTDISDLILSRLQCVRPRLRVRLDRPLIQPSDPTCLALLDSAINEGRVEANLADLEHLKHDLADLESNRKGEFLLSPGLEALCLSVAQEEFRRVSSAVQRAFPFVPTVSVRG